MWELILVTRGQFLENILSPLIVLNLEMAMVDKVISELKSASGRLGTV